MGLRHAPRALFWLVFVSANICSRAVAGVPTTPPAVQETLSNGMRVVLVRNPLAPIVTVQANVLAGGAESPPGFPGMAHALEHMAFRGCADMTANQTAALYAQLGSENNAETDQSVTEFYATVPAADLDLALEAQAKCLWNIENSEEEWVQERKALEEEVRGNYSDPEYSAVLFIRQKLFAGTPYVNDSLGSVESFERTDGAMLRDYYRKWYGPSNIVLVIVGDIDPQQTLSRVHELFGTTPGRGVPIRNAVALQQFKPLQHTLRTNVPFIVCLAAYRLPGTDSPDYAATALAIDILGGDRGPVRGMASAGRIMEGQFEQPEGFREASIGLLSLTAPTGHQAAMAMRKWRESLATYARHGVPAELVVAAKKRELMRAMSAANSIPQLAEWWSRAVAVEGRASPEEDILAIRRVTAADVTSVIRRYLRDDNRVVVTMKPALHEAVAIPERSHTERRVKEAAPEAIKAPEWARARLELPPILETGAQTADLHLGNGIHLIVRTNRATPTITLTGSVKHNTHLDTPKKQEGISDVLDGLFSYGTSSKSREQFQRDLDQVGADEQAGFQFFLNVATKDFPRGLELLAENELHPAITSQNFRVVRHRMLQLVGRDEYDPDNLLAKSLNWALLPKNDPELRRTTPETLTGLTLDEVRSYYSSTMRPDVTTIVIVGDISADEARTAVESSFGGWVTTRAAAQTELPPVPENRQAFLAIVDRSRQQDRVVLSEQVNVSRSDSDYYALRLGTAVLAGGFYGGRLYRHLRQTNGYVYSVDAELSLSAHRAAYTITFECQPENVYKVRKIIERDLNQMRSEAISLGELQQAKALLLRQAALSEMSEETVASGLMARAEDGIPLDEPSRLRAIYGEITAQEITKAFARTIDVNRLVQLVVGPEPPRRTVGRRP